MESEKNTFTYTCSAKQQEEIGVAATYLICGLVTKKERNRIAPQIIALSNELTQ